MSLLLSTQLTEPVAAWQLLGEPEPAAADRTSEIQRAERELEAKLAGMKRGT